MTAFFESLDFQGLPALRLRAPDGGTVIVTDFGAHAVSWQPTPGHERLYLSDTAVLDGTRPIRGGIPVVFPQFGLLGSLPRHGFARTRVWERADQQAGADYTQATWTLRSDPASLALWPATFVAELTVCVGSRRLDVELYVANEGDITFAFTGALHTYCAVGEVEQTILYGLGGTTYRDALRASEEVEQRENALRIDREVDRIYLATNPELVLDTPVGATRIEQSGFEDTVVWNPWTGGTQVFADLPPLGFRRFLCVESAAIAVPIEVLPGESWSGRQSLILEA
ncbi:MAG: D-hexose-6-phosphate mutarotase [Burkholderiales bacterium]